MSALVVLVIVAAVTVVVVQVARQAGAGRRAVEHHHRALDTLSQITGHAGERPADVGVPDDVVGPHVAVHPHVRVLPIGRAGTAPPATATTPTRESLAPAPPHSVVPAPADHPHDHPHDLVEAGAAAAAAKPAGSYDQEGPGRPAAIPGAGAIRRRHPPRRRRTATQTVLAAAILVVGALVAVFAGLGSPNHAHPGRAVHGSEPVTPPTSAPVPTVPPSTVSLVSATAQTASYQVQGSASIKVVSAARCWVEIRDGGPSGQIVFQGVLAAGQTETAPGPAWLRVGDPPAVSVTVNGTPLTPPAMAGGTPYDFVVQ